MAKKVNVAIFPDTVNDDKCEISHGGSTHRALPIHATFSDLDCIARSQQCQTVLTENVSSYPFKLKVFV